MKIAIHNSKNSFSDRWIEYCDNNNIEFKLVNCYDTKIIDQISDCDGLMWHYHHGNYKDMLFAKELLFALEQTGKKVFPNFNTSWHFDDKVGQKYLLESLKLPHVKTYVFYDKKTAKKWINEVNFPKVFKLRGGAGSTNVSLIKSKRDALKKVNIAFKKGFSQFNRAEHLKESYRIFKINYKFIHLIKGLVRSIIGTQFSSLTKREKGYIYFQDFIPNNDHDIRIIIIGDKAFGLKRYTRENDFRASGSGKISYVKDDIPIACLRMSFELNKKLNTQSVALDFVFDEENNPLIVEISYGFAINAYDFCPGYWDEQLKWNETKFNPQYWMIENFIKK